ncbi:hypothetical protein [Nocardia pneumoniae]|uniref:hypothetical protein n=1 Tax=Nocardia pneumoniae TaxID=228601 RepID=UPI0003024A40|nr:hypothetical protein [Nocardia pneumoniae]
MKARTLLGSVVAAAAVSMAGSAVAAAAPTQIANQDPAEYLVGDTVYFAYASSNCAIRPNGDVGCDIPFGTNLYGFPIYDLAIDLPFLPAHPTFGLVGAHGRPGSQPIAGTINYAGASCTGGGRGALTCTSKGHSFSFGWSGTQIS